MDPAEASPRPIGIVEDDPAVMKFFVSVIAGADDLSLAFAVGTRAEALAAIGSACPRLCLVDLGLPDGSGIDIVRFLKSQGACKALVTTVLGDRGTVMKVLRAGADGYLLKSMGQADILTDIRGTLAGCSPVSSQIATYLLELLKPASQSNAEAGGVLTPRETEVLAIFSRGLTYDETARLLGISINTVRDHVKRIYMKLDVTTRSEAVFEAQHLGLIGEPHRHET